MAKRKKSKISEENKLKLTESVNWLIYDAQLYDKGDFTAIKRSSVTLRSLFHDTKQSHSLLGQIETKEKKNNLQFTISNPPLQPTQSIYYSSIFIAIFQINGLNNGRYYNTYLFDPNRFNANRSVDFSKWWNETIFKVTSTSLTRKKLILTVANQDGAAHYDPDISKSYSAVVDGSTGFNVIVNTSDLSLLGIKNIKDEKIIFKDAHLALLRQIVHEAIEALIKKYDLQVSYTPDFSYNKNRTVNEVHFQLSDGK